MLHKKNSLLSAISLILGLTLSGQAFASNGFFAIGQGTKSKGMGGVGQALSQDSMAAAINPAGMVFQGDRFDIGIEYLKTSTTIDDPSVPGFDTKLYPLSLGYNGMLSPQSSVGVSLYANDGIDGDSRLIQSFANFSYSHIIGEKSSLGGSIIVAGQFFDTIGNGGSGVTDITYGAGFSFGWQGYVGAGITLGATYQSQIKMSENTDYSLVLPDNGEIDIPSTYGAGIAWKHQGLTLAADYQVIKYGNVTALSYPLGFGWSDIKIYKLGAQYELKEWAFRAGWNHSENPIPGNTLDTYGVMPNFITDHMTAGLSKKFGQSSELNVALIYGFKASQSWASSTSPGTTYNADATQYAAEISYGVRF